jgi:GNAT superfamily N-acetyltransferase
MIYLRPFQGEYDLLEELFCSDPSQAQGRQTASALQFLDLHNRFPGQRRWLMTHSASSRDIIATCWITQDCYHYHPQVWSIGVFVHPLYRSRGLGSLLYQHIHDLATLHPPVQFRKRLREDQIDGQTFYFLRRKKFVEARRLQESVLDISLIKGERFPSLPHSLRLFPYNSLPDPQPQREQKYFSLLQALMPDIPLLPPRPLLSFNDFQRYRLPLLNLACTVIAYDISTSEYVGLCELRKTVDPTKVTMGVTGVILSYRRQGIATAMKITAIHLAHKNQIEQIWTTNDRSNMAILRLNVSLGFKPTHTLIDFVASPVT